MIYLFLYWVLHNMKNVLKGNIKEKNMFYDDIMKNIFLDW